MDVAKLVFESIDKAFDKKMNKNFRIEGAEKVVVTKDVLYSDVNIKTCLLDYYYVPKKEGLYPVLFNIHGGGFMAGDKQYRKALCTWHAVNGLFVVNVNYGLCPDCNYPTPILHLADALNWVVKFADILRLDLNKMAVCGDSAGGYYAAMLAAICNSEQLQKAFNVTPKANFSAAILNCGLYDIESTLKSRMVLDLNKKVFSAYTGYDEEDFVNFEYKDYCSPVGFINENFPSSFIIYANRDVFCKGQTEPLIQKLEQNDVYYESYYSTSLLRNHCFSLDWSTKESKEVNALIREFMNKFVDGSLPRKISQCDVRIREHEKRSTF